MKKIEILDEGVLYRNANPGIRAEDAFLPNIVPISETEVMCFYRVGTAFYSVDGKIAKLRSLDGGRTWDTKGYVWDPKNDDFPWNYSAPHATRFSDGSMVVMATRLDCSDEELPMINPETGGSRPSDMVIFRSDDNGHTWTEPEVLDLPGGGIPDAPSQIIELNDGRWWLPMEQWKSWDDDGPFNINGFCVFSDDKGKTWGDRVDYPSASDPVKVFSHSRYTRMLDGRIGVLQWTQEHGTAKDFDMHYTVSDQTGKVWSTPQPTGIMAQTSWMADLGDGVLAAAYTDREGRNPGINIIVSDDEGKTWDSDNQVMVWDAVGQEYLGIEKKPEYPASHDNIAFGKPNLARLPNGELIAAWWCTQACVTHARFARLSVG